MMRVVVVVVVVRKRRRRRTTTTTTTTMTAVSQPNFRRLSYGCIDIKYCVEEIPLLKVDWVSNIELTL